MKKALMMFAAIVAAMFVYAQEEEAPAAPAMSEAAQEVARLTAELKTVKADISAAKKDLQQQKSASSKVRNSIRSKGAHLIGTVDQRNLLDRRRPTKEEKRLYPTGDIMIVKAKCVCSHYPEGTDQEHTDSVGGFGGGFGNSMMNGRSNSNMNRKPKACSQYQAWRKAMDEVDKTTKMIAQLEPLLAEEDKTTEKMAELEAKKKELEAELKAAKKAKAAEAAAATGDNQ